MLTPWYSWNIAKVGVKHQSIIYLTMSDCKTPVIMKSTTTVQHTLWKESFKKWYGHTFYQYQQNEQSPLILTELTEHKKDNDIWG